MACVARSLCAVGVDPADAAVGPRGRKDLRKTESRVLDSLPTGVALEAIDGVLPLYSCQKTTRGCPPIPLCPISEVFEAARQKMGAVLEATSIKDIAQRIAKRSASWLKVTECA